MNQSPHSPTALVTGASSGIGRELAKVFAREGYNLALVARRRQRLFQLASELEAEYGTSVRVLPRDLSLNSSAREIFDELQREAIAIDVLVNNAGFSAHGRFSEADGTREMQMIQVNLVSLTQLTRLFLPGMVERGRGRILNVGSTGSFMPVPLSAVYGATKAYVLSFSEAIAKELEETGVTVTALCPGVTLTEFQATAQIEGIRLLRFGSMSASAVAEIGYRGMTAGKKVVIPGAFNKLLVWSVRFAPREVIVTISKIMMARGG